MERTGHRSIEGVRSYKRTSNDQRRALSDILNRLDTTTTLAQEENHKQNHPHGSSSISSSPQPTHHGLNLASASFSHCTINFNVPEQ